MARIVIDARESGTSTGRYIDKLVENLHALKPAHDFVILTKPHRATFFRQNCPNFEVVESKYKEFTFGEQYGLVWQLYGLKNNLVHFGMTQQPVLYFGSSITTIHDLTTIRFRNPARNRLVFDFKRVVYKRVVKRVARKSKYLLVPSEFVKTDVLKFTGVNPQKIIVTYEAADKITAKAEPIKGLAGQDFLLYVGRAQPHKNLDRLVEAFVAARANHPDLKLVLAGRQDVLYERLEKRITKQGFEGVIFTDFVTEGQLRWLYERCRAYVFASLSEGFGLPGLEAMAHGAPVVSSNVSCLPEIYSTAALYFDPMDTTDIATKLDQLLSDSKLRQNLIKAGHKQVIKYSWLQMAQKTLSVYDKSLKNT